MIRPFTQPAPLEPRQSQDSPGSVELQIDELVLDGFDAVDKHAIGNAVERELARVFLERGIAQVTGDEIEIDQIRAGATALDRSSDGEAIASELAKVLSGGLKR